MIPLQKQSLRVSTSCIIMHACLHFSYFQHQQLANEEMMAASLQYWFSLLIALRLFLFLEFVEGNFGPAVYCVDSTSNSSDCLVNGCCNSLSLLLSEIYAQYGNALSLEPPQTSRPIRIISVEIHSDLNLNETVKFENLSGIEIKGMNNTSLLCSKNEDGEMNAGLYFRNVDNIVMMDLSFLHCGSLQRSTSQYDSTVKDFNLFHSSLYFRHCSNMTLVNITIKDSYGTGAALFDVLGSISIFHCWFENNKVKNPKNYSGGGGLLIEFTNCLSGKSGDYRTGGKYQNSHYTIQNCTFINNTASSLKSIYIHSQGPFQGFGRGGGLAVYLNGSTEWCLLTVTKCCFQNNVAFLGGGMFVMFQDNTSHNNITIEDSDFIMNHAIAFRPHSDKEKGTHFHKRGGGGGGAGGGFLLSHQNPVMNSYVFVNCRFAGNRADGNGGGLSIFSTRMISSAIARENTITLINCNMSGNSAYVASALDIAPEVYDRLGSGALSIPVIINCTFISNHIINRELQSSPTQFANAFLNGIATVFICTFLVEFRGNIVFMHNNETALHLSSASVTLKKGSSIHFEGNHAKYGGAVSMIALSVIRVENDCCLKFINNTAIAKGGAFYVYSNDHQHESQFSYSCFIQHQGEKSAPGSRNITFVFQNNSALTGIGDVLYATSLLPCIYDQHTPSDVFHDVGSVIPQSERKNCLNIATLVYNFQFNEQTLNHMQQLIPGVQFNMNINAIDELEQNQTTMFYAYMASPGNITVDPAYSQVSNNIIKVRGTKTEIVEALTLETSIATIYVDIGLGDCPPGFSNEGGACVCSASNFLGIARCERNSTYVFRGYWIGRCHNGEICSAHCPEGYCYRSQNNSEEFLLPSDIDELDHFICGPYRTGTLCGQCVNGSSVQYHSHAYTCKPNKYCKIGILFYFLSEIVPLIIFFTVVMIFNISFTSGTLNGFILFAQMSDTIDVNAGGTIGLSEHVEIATYAYKVIYRAFNFDFFSLDKISFCLWESATTMDALSMKFLTITFALLLIILIIFVFNTWKFKLWCHWIRPRTLKAAFTHGLSTLLIVSFSQCARVSFLILSPTLLSIGVRERIPVVFYSGDLEPFVGKHLKYALPALFFLLLLVILPLLWLLSYPLLFKTLGICRLSETKFSACLSRLFPIELLDFFQSCFKENHRYFAGLYLLYRFVPLVIFANVHRLLQFHAMLSVQFLIMFTLHSVIQPYKSQWHNRLDSFILANISLVNSLTTYNYAVLSTGDQLVYKYTVHWIIYFQIVLMYCPLFYLLYYSVTEVYFRVKMQCKGYVNVSLEDSDSLPPLRDF